MKKKLLISLLVVSILLLTVFFLGGNPPSMRGFYYVSWLSLSYLVFWRKRDMWRHRLQRSPFGHPATFIGLGLLMILIEETFAGLSVNILHSLNIAAIIASIPQYYANNFLLLPGFVLAWYFLLKRYEYTEAEVFLLSGLFGVFAEKTYLHVLTIPILGIPLILPTMFAYFAILFPSFLSFQPANPKSLNKPAKYLLSFLFPILVTLPFLLLHALLSKNGLIDPTVLQK